MTTVLPAVGRWVPLPDFIVGAVRSTVWNTAGMRTQLSEHCPYMMAALPFLNGPREAVRCMRVVWQLARTRRKNKGWFHVEALTIYKLGFNQNYCTFAFMLLIKILMCGEFHGIEFANYQRFPYLIRGSARSWSDMDFRVRGRHNLFACFLLRLLVEGEDTVGQGRERFVDCDPLFETRLPYTPEPKQVS